MGVEETGEKKNSLDNDSQKKAIDLFIGLFHDIRAETQNLQELLVKIKQKTELTNISLRSTEVFEALQQNHKIFENNFKQIKGRINELRKVLTQNPELYCWCGDTIVQIENFWERASANWPKMNQSVDEVLYRINEVDQLLNKIIYQCVFVTSPSRVNQHLSNLKVGQAFNFHENFKDELSKEEDRKEILSYLQSQPKAIEGVVDVEQGIIYKASTEDSRRRQSYLLISALILGGFGIVFLFSNLGSWLNLQGWPVTPSRSGELIVGYFFVIIGSFVHLGIDAFKQVRAKKGFLALEDWLLWIHVKEQSVCAGVVSLWVGFFGLAYLQRIDWQIAFLVGYSIDSFVDLFLQRFTNVVSTRTKALKEKLS